MRRAWIIVWIALVSPSLGAEPPVVKSAAPAPDLDALFERADGWIGADGAHSVSVSPKRTLWLFSDTWVGKVRDGRRTDATIVNTTVGVQAGSGGRVTYTIAREPDGKPAALIAPADGRGWFWLQAGTVYRGRLSLLLNQVEKTGDKGVFGFRSVGLWLGTVADADKPPDSWRVEQVKMPNAVFSKDHMLAWGAAVLRVGDDLYVYGTDERRRKGSLDRQMVIARVPAASVDTFAAWRYFRDGSWDEDYRNPSPLAGIEPQAALVLLGRCAVAGIAMISEDGADARLEELVRSGTCVRGEGRKRQGEL
jgi:hypothetical protein